MPFFTSDYLEFFEELADPENNNKDWFDENRDRYVEHVREPFKDFANVIATKLREFDPEIDPSPYIYRINNDLRFQPDKVPYKLHKSASFSPVGNAIAPAGYYFQISASEIFLGGGMYEVSTERKNKIREHIAANVEEFKELIADNDFKRYYKKIEGGKNKRLPKSLQSIAEQEPLIYNKQWYYSTTIPAELILSDRILDEMTKRYKVIYELNRFFRAAESS